MTYTYFRVVKAKYSNKNMIAAASALFGNTTYGDLNKYLVTVALPLVFAVVYQPFEEEIAIDA
jgi:hypothetical protein